MKTEELISALSADLRPVRPVRHPLLRCAGWLVFAAFTVSMLGVARGVRPDLTERLQDLQFIVMIIGAILTACLAAISAFLVSLPDRSGRWALLPIPAAVLWFATIGFGCIYNWVSLTPDGIGPGRTLACFATLALTSTPLSLAMYIMLRDSGRLRMAPVAICGTLSIAAITAIALSLFHEFDATALILIWNAGVAIVFTLAGGLFARIGREQAV